MIWDVLANITQDQALDSIRSTLGGRVDIGLLLWVTAAALVVVGLLVYISQRMKRDPAGLNNQAKLIREISQAVGLKPTEIKKLKTLVEQVEAPGKAPPRNPLVLLLCPSLLAKAMKKKG